MNEKTVISIAQNAISMDTYYQKLNALKEDVEFFTLFMKRNKKSDFDFNIRVTYSCSFKAFNDIWEKYDYYQKNLETAFSEFIVLKSIIEDLYNGTGIYTDAEIREFIEYFQKYNETHIYDYIGDFIGCSRGIADVERQLSIIMERSNINSKKREQ